MMMRPIHYSASLVLAGLMACGTLAVAETVLIETAPEGQNRDRYEEISGTWGADIAPAPAPGLTSGATSRALLAAEGRLSGSARFTTTLEEGGDYHIDIAAPANANARNVTVLLEGAPGSKTAVVEFIPGEAGKPGEWMRLGTVKVEPGATATLTITADSSTGPVSDSEPFLLAIAAARFTNEDLPAFPATEASAGSGQVAIFSAPPQQAVRNPFEDTIADAEANPFSEEPPPAGENPFSAPPAATEENPFGSAAAPVADNPFRQETTESETSNPFASAPAVAENPFDSAPASEVENPFAGTRTTEALNPFDGGTARAETSNPFGETTATTASPFAGAPPASATSPFDQPVSNQAAPANPFAGAPAQTTSPFDSAPASTGATASSPFAGAPAQTTSPFDSAGTTSSPFDSAGTASSPFGSAPAPTGTTASSPFGAPAVSEVPVATPEPLDPRLAFPAAPPATAVATSGRDVLAEMDKLTTVDAARARAQAEDKPIFLYFGGDSAEAQRFESTLNHPAVAEKLGDFILMRVDYRENRELAGKFAVNRFPYVVVLNKMGYTAGHVMPTTNANSLVRSLEPFTLRY